MLPDITHFPVNWVDGMKISSRDFISMENAALEGVRDAQASKLNQYNFGLLPTNHPEVDSYPKLVYDYINNLLILKDCRALTPAGQRIEITEANHERKKYPTQLPSVPISLLEAGRFDVYLHVDTSVRVGAGDFAQNNPPRYTAVSPKYELSVKPHDGINVLQGNFLKISEIEVREGRVEILTLSGKYIPPCTSLNAFAGLMRLHGSGEELLTGLLQHYSNLMNRIGVESRNEIAEEALVLSEKVVSPFISSLSYYRHILPTYAPIYTVVYFKDFARFIKYQLDRPYRAEIINQFKPNLMELAVNLERTEPQHMAMKVSFDRILDLLEELDVFLNELSKYNYNNRAFDLYDHNHLTQTFRAQPVPIEHVPVVEVPVQPVETKKVERVF